MQVQSEELRTKKKNAGIKLTLRILVALYILYLTKGIVFAQVKHTSSLPLLVTVLASVVFFLAAIAFGLYAWREYKNSLTVRGSGQGPGSPGDGGKNLSDSIDRK
ncbi:hypothetical protein CAFE_00290 [Caprobacter fermentans]|uniref:Uncharacterized protein n=1 Tax=Caproicibacter fermentans TaxID=2576756 RepID=A0A6N8HUB8_9FIRM|nr:hypothetical protein [Caproicibacter fermentans]MVB09381.1 hypothetical protein [Caproicibacter fermentans]OCN02782.1 hypothetical protein A7X67_02700 [Clostridium sp. W14A]QNK40479.1 hypothetical protein HCR03_17825 [Caproicibacter fermentans]